jgi:2-keto-4-pentenoate hydratase/2-oxohepta-3-ene-1,7-dioic acid hydratase in catechol pathway
MQLCTIRTPSGHHPAVSLPGRGAVLASDLVGRETGDLMSLLAPEALAELAWAIERRDASERIVRDPAYAAPYLNPGKILGIGLNYGAHAGDLGAQAPRTSPASFLKGSHTIIGPGDPIVVPRGIGRVTAEAELGLIIGRECYQVDKSNALDYVAGVVAVLDQTAEEVLLENPRFLTRVKNYPTFFSFGPVIVTMDEVLDAVHDLEQLAVATVHNGHTYRADVVSGMTFSPAELLSFHSKVMPFHPGDILSTGTPGAVAITGGDTVSCDLGNGLIVLANPVVGASSAAGQVCARGPQSAE